MKSKAEPKPVRISDIIKNRRRAILERRGWISLLVRIAVLALVFCLIFSQLFLICQLEGNGMYPALKDGDLLLAYRLQNVYMKDDIVLFEHEGKTTAGRIVANQNDYVMLSEDGMLRVNGNVQSGEIMYPSYPKEGIEYPFMVPEGHVFVMGDYRTQCTDSRDFGPVALEDIQGKLISFLRRRGL